MAMHRRARRILVVGMAAVAAAVVLSGCVPKPVPIHVDSDAGTTTSKAEWRVAAVNTSKGPGIEVRFRNCASLLMTGSAFPEDIHGHLRPVAFVRDGGGTGKVIFNNASPIDEVRPAGSQVIDTKTPDTDDLQRIIIPTSKATGALKIETNCTTYQGWGSGPAYSWNFTPCTTSTRSCATRTGGSGIFRP
jgi:hypothetical protein